MDFGCGSDGGRGGSGTHHLGMLRVGGSMLAVAPGYAVCMYVC